MRTSISIALTARSSVSIKLWNWHGHSLSPPWKLPSVYTQCISGYCGTCTLYVVHYAFLWFCSAFLTSHIMYNFHKICIYMIVYCSHLHFNAYAFITMHLCILCVLTPCVWRTNYFIFHSLGTYNESGVWWNDENKKKKKTHTHEELCSRLNWMEK